MQNMETTMQILAIDSDHDLTTQITRNYRDQHVYPYLESQGFGLVRCQGTSACRENVAPEARRDDIVYITGAGHGSGKVYTGHDNEPIFEVGNYHPEESYGKVVHFLSCQTAAELGPDFVKNGCLAYFGYKRTFAFHPDYPDICLECDSEIDRAFADGLTAEEVYNRVEERYEQRIAELRQDIAELYQSIAELQGEDRKDINDRISMLEDTLSALEHDLSWLCAPSVDSRWGDTQVRIR